MQIRHRFRSYAMGIGFVAVILTMGCRGGKPMGTVTGKVTLKGEPVLSGSVNFISITGAADMAKVDETGSYKMGPIEAGKYIVYILPPIPEQLPPGKKPPPPPAPFKVPKNYQAPETSSLTAEVKEGQNDIPITIN